MSKPAAKPRRKAAVPKAGETWFVRFGGERHLTTCEVDEVTGRVIALRVVADLAVRPAYEVWAVRGMAVARPRAEPTAPAYRYEIGVDVTMVARACE